ncbi:MAG: 4-alpha-glucanotransferase [Prevotella sp.]|nr:4-alpha-glucanotransferase [Prevotella sp.]
MKLSFSIEYGTQWGETLHVVVTYRSLDGTEKAYNLLMATQDGMRWTLETAVMESRQHPIATFTYFYQVENADGHVLRREWTGVPRCYHFDATKNYLMPDQWRDIPLQYHLYSNAYATMHGRAAGEQTEALRVPFYRKTILFRVSAPQLQKGQSLALVGSHPALGDWNPARYLRMEYMGRCDWMLSVNADALLMPIEYKYVVVDDKTNQLVSWEEGENRTTEGLIEGEQRDKVPDGTVLVAYGGGLRMKEQTWRAAGVCVPVFSLRSEQSYGVGDFADLKLLVDWCVETGMRVVQLLPVNDTTDNNTWNDSYPYNIVSAFALHPHYLSLEALGTLKSKARMTVYRRRRQELNALGYSDYLAVGRVKKEYVGELFAERGQQTLDSREFKEWFADNRDWLEPYALWRTGGLRKKARGKIKGAAQKINGVESEINGLEFKINGLESEINGVAFQTNGAASESNGAASAPKGAAAGTNASVAETDTLKAELIYFVQFHLHRQLKAAADYAREKGVVLKGDIPIGVNRESVVTATHPELFHLDQQAGAPPDLFSHNGQNWGFPTYRWASEGGERLTSRMLRMEQWFHHRLRWMEQYFDAIRIDHVLGFFRIWEIPDEQLFGEMGHFSPALPMSAEEIGYFGLPFRKEMMTQPFVNDRIIDQLFGIHANYVRENCLEQRGYGLWRVKPAYATQRKIRELFEGRGDENSIWIRDGLYHLVANVLFVEDPQQAEMYHPRIGAIREPVFDALGADEKDAYLRLYNNYFYQRHNFFWGSVGIRRLTDIFGQTPMLCCAEDLGMVPDCVGHVLDQLRILSLEIQTMPKQQGFEFAHLDGNPYRSVCTISTHDMAPLRLWWEESPERTQRFYVTMLQKEGRAPEHLPAHLAEEIIARHLYCPSMFCILSLQDWLAMDAELRSKNPREERINTPSDAYNQWKYRMHLTLEQLIAASRYNNKVKTMITRSKRA